MTAPIVCGPRGGVRRRADERGSVAPLIAVCLMIALGLALTGAAATSLHLERMRLLALADAAALQGAETFALTDVRLGATTVTPRLTDAAVREAATDSVGRARAAAALDGLGVAEAHAEGGRIAVVSLRAVWHPPVLSALFPAALTVEVTSRAEARFH